MNQKKQTHNKQVDKDSYTTGYVSLARWSSYFYQIKLLRSLQAIESILEVGSATMVVKDHFARMYPHISYSIADIDHELQPEFVGSVTDLPLDDKAVDVSCAFQVLEHIEFKDFPTGLDELARVAKKYVLISLPHHGWHIRFECKIPLLPRLRFAMKSPFAIKNHSFDGQHYWEIGKKDFSLAAVNKIIGERFEIIDHFIPYENQFHRFYVLRPK